MRFTATLVSLAVLFTSASARPSLKEICGANSIITQKTLVAPSGREITLTTRTCPGLASLRNTTTTSSTVHKRQTLQCDPTPNCSGVECDTTAPQPNVQDCNNLAIDLIDLNEIVAVPSQGVLNAHAGTCEYQYGVIDTVTYDVCTATFGLLGQDAVTHCFDDLEPTTTFTAGFCLSPEVPGNDWIVEASLF